MIFSFTITETSLSNKHLIKWSMSVRKLRLTSHFRDSTYEDKSVVKNGSTFTPKNNENQELENQTCR